MGQSNSEVRHLTKQHEAQVSLSELGATVINFQNWDYT